MRTSEQHNKNVIFEKRREKKDKDRDREERKRRGHYNEPTRAYRLTAMLEPEQPSRARRDREGELEVEGGCRQEETSAEHAKILIEKGIRRRGGVTGCPLHGPCLRAPSLLDRPCWHRANTGRASCCLLSLAHLAMYIGGLLFWAAIKDVTGSKRCTQIRGRKTYWAAWCALWRMRWYLYVEVGD